MRKGSNGNKRKVKDGFVLAYDNVSYRQSAFRDCLFSKTKHLQSLYNGNGACLSFAKEIWLRLDLYWRLGYCLLAKFSKELELK